MLLQNYNLCITQIRGARNLINLGHQFNSPHYSNISSMYDFYFLGQFKLLIQAFTIGILWRRGGFTYNFTDHTIHPLVSYYSLTLNRLRENLLLALAAMWTVDRRDCPCFLCLVPETWVHSYMKRITEISSRKW
jgi:hypothetical protein